MSDLNTTKYANISRRSFLKGALALGGALALAGCSEPEPVVNTVTVTQANTVTVTNTETKTVTVTATATETVTVPAPPADPGEVPNMITSPSMILPRYTHCDGCNLCMIACSFNHGCNGDIGYSNIKVYSLDIQEAMVDIPVICMKCNDTPCLASCPTQVSAISVDEVTGAVKIDHEKCILCGNCIEACKDRTGVLSMSRNDDRIVGSCDLCEGNPACVQICPNDTLNIITKNLRGETFALDVWTLGQRAWNTLYSR